jgi:hypothetical protein
MGLMVTDHGSFFFLLLLLLLLQLLLLLTSSLPLNFFASYCYHSSTAPTH